MTTTIYLGKGQAGENDRKEINLHVLLPFPACMHAPVTQLCPTLCAPMDCILSCILDPQARMLE